jgi:putative DNA methylase
MTERKKLIEVALPLDAINRESAREKSIRHGHPSTLHLWWARRPLAACRAVLFAQMVDDPASRPDLFPTQESQEKERQRLFSLIEELVKWENINNEPLLQAARDEIKKYADGELPPVLDPFCGGGSIPLEAQRLGLEAHGSDLNPVAVLITKALIEIPPKFAGRKPVRPAQGQQEFAVDSWQGAQGLAEDVRYYGQWMRKKAEERIGHLYPEVKVTEEMASNRKDLQPLVGQELTVIAWLWARTVASPNPACNGAHVPLVRSFVLSKKKNNQAWVEPIISEDKQSYYFEVRTGSGKSRAGTVNRRGGTCLLSGVPMPFDYIRAEGQAGRMGARLMAIVAEGPSGRVYMPPVAEHEDIANVELPANIPTTSLPEKALGFRVQQYGMTRHSDLFTPRQLTALTTFSDLVQDVRAEVLRDALAAGLAGDVRGLEEGGRGAAAYADAVATYLSFVVDRMADYNSSICVWHTSGEKIAHTFGRQAIPMVWDYVESNPLCNSTGNFDGAVTWICKVVANSPKAIYGRAKQANATESINEIQQPVLSTDPPYYDNIGYADLADFFYIWLRRSLGDVYPQLFSTILVPKDEELVATPYRFEGDKEKAREFFETGLGQAFAGMRAAQNPKYPLTVYYAFKQAESETTEAGKKTASTGWETMLEGLVKSGFRITGTWPMRTELLNRPVASGANALASSVVLVCRPRAKDAPMTTRRDFFAALKRELPEAIKKLQIGNIAPVDMNQAVIGPGMAVFSRYGKVIEADGTAMRVREALALIDQVYVEFMSEQEGEYDAPTRWALAWFEDYGMEAGPYGIAETLSTAKNTAVAGMANIGIVEAHAGKVRLLKRSEYSEEWDPLTDRDLTVWKVAQHLVRAHSENGDNAAADILRKTGALGDTARNLAYRLYTICERKNWSEEALPYNALVVSWPEIQRLAGKGNIEQSTWI